MYAWKSQLLRDKAASAAMVSIEVSAKRWHRKGGVNTTIVNRQLTAKRMVTKAMVTKTVTTETIPRHLSAAIVSRTVRARGTDPADT